MIWHYSNTESWTVEDVEGPESGYPASDVMNRTMYINTHFRSALEAWQSLLDNAIAGVSLSASAVTEAQDRLRRAEQLASQSATDLRIVRDGMDAAGYTIMVTPLGTSEEGR